MFKVEMSTPDRVDLEISGKLTSQEMRTALDELTSASAGVKHGSMCCLIHDFDFPSLGAVGVELSRLPSLFGLIRRFDRAAVITDKQWVRTASQIEGKLLPGFEVKAFDLAGTAEAEAWLAQ